MLDHIYGVASIECFTIDNRMKVIGLLAPLQMYMRVK